MWKWLALDVQLAETAVCWRDPSYAQVGYGLSLGRTEHEERVGPPLPSMTLPTRGDCCAGTSG
ncbi:hypothetical protein [Streptomyces sp. NPDC085540]|uniref:hypothetical protein n=1 Tax=Streptomyces sp. NPDC085540 TaxID=3365730 RepID=UPI0037D4811D